MNHTRITAQNVEFSRKLSALYPVSRIPYPDLTPNAV